MIHVAPDWWQTLFDEVYLITDAPFVDNPALTQREVEVAARLLRLRPGEGIDFRFGVRWRFHRFFSRLGRGFERDGQGVFRAQIDGR